MNQVNIDYLFDIQELSKDNSSPSGEKGIQKLNLHSLAKSWLNLSIREKNKIIQNLKEILVSNTNTDEK